MTRFLTIDASPKQLSKLRNGHAVRIKKGTGFNLLVHPETYSIVSRAFAKSKGAEISLSPEEIEMNRQLSPEQHQQLRETQPEMAGQGIFGRKFDRKMEKVLGKKLQKKVYGELRKSLPAIQAGVDTAITTGATALSAAYPELAPFIMPASEVAGNYLNDYLENPSDYQPARRGKKSGRTGVRSAPERSMMEKMAKAKMTGEMNRRMGTNYDYMNRAGLEKAMAEQLSSRMRTDSIASRFGGMNSQMPISRSLTAAQAAEPEPMPSFDYGSYYGSGSGLGAGLIKTARREIGSIRGRGSMIYGDASPHYPPALRSQPFSANFQMQHFLPVQYQGLNSGSGLYV